MIGCKISLFPKKVSQLFVGDSFIGRWLVIAKGIIFKRFLEDRLWSVLNELTLVCR